METPSSSRTWFLGLAFAALLVWRCASRPTAGLWQDWVILLSVYGIYTLRAGASRHWPPVTLTLMSFLLGIYVSGQLPHTLHLLGLRP